jgi:hypothetical protein
MRAWSYGPGLTMYVNRLRAEMRTSRVSIMAHSLGNAVAGSALRGGMTIDSYVAMEAAVSLSCYFSAPRPTEPDPLAKSSLPELEAVERKVPTPNNYIELGYRGFLRNILSGIAGRITAYQNVGDFWLATGTTAIGHPHVDWINNQITYKPNNLRGLNVLKAYEFHPERSEGMQVVLSAIGFGNDRVVDNSHESMAYVARSHTAALGSEASNQNAQPPGWSPSLDLKATYNFSTPRYDHSGQFQRNIQRMYGDLNGNPLPVPFYQQLIEDLRVVSE